MSTPFDRRSLRRRPFFSLFVALCLFGPTQLQAQQPTNRESDARKLAPRQLGRDIVGVFTRRAVPHGGAPHVEGRQHKFFADKYWVATHRDDSGYMVYAVGGTYDLVDGNYTETDRFGTYYCQGLIGGVFQFKIDVDRKNFWQIGMNNEYTEKYTRVTDRDESPLAQKLHGAWTRTAADDDSAKLKQYKFYDSGRWIRLDTNKDGLAVTAHGGKYQLAYDVLTEETTSSTDFTVHPIGEVKKSKVVAQDDAIQLTAIDGQQTEEWARAK